jgi:hypothetical protein
MFPFISPSGQSCLPHENEAGEENSFNGHGGSEKRQRHRIKVWESRVGAARMQRYDFGKTSHSRSMSGLACYRQSLDETSNQLPKAQVSEILGKICMTNNERTS